MKFQATHIDYATTGLFSTLVKEYIQNKGTARSFVPYEPTYQGVKEALEQRKKYPTNRKVLVEVLIKQYQNLSMHQKVEENIQLLGGDNTFVVTTAHQPNIFTGPLYFFYKIIHAIQLAADLKKQFPENNFVPVYYMGSEDADIEEVGSFVLGGTTYQWNTKQKGAVGRMKVDDALIALLKNMEGYWSVKPNGKEALAILQNAYQKGKTIAEATIELVNAFFGDYGLIVVQPDDASFKSLFLDTMKLELLTGFSHKAIQPTLQALTANYHVQSEGRALNLFYLKDDIRARIEKQDNHYLVADTDIRFTEEEILNELQVHPERFSPNVILRGVFQETILPGVVFIGGGGELAYWMELKNVFGEAKVHMPVLQLRNSFMFIRAKQIQQWTSLGLIKEDLFKPVLDIEVAFVKKQSGELLSLEAELKSLEQVYDQIQKRVKSIDATLGAHANNLSHQSTKKLLELEKKMIRAERRKQAVSIERIHAIKHALFPYNGLQERVENIAEWMGDYGQDWLDAVIQSSPTMQQNFTIVDQID
jgi:bacillithiol biosynthesis cysteine-adding enzyme BshC